MPSTTRSRVWMVAAAIVLFFEGDSFLDAEAFVLPSGLAIQRNNKLPGLETNDDQQQQQQQKHNLAWTPLHSFKFIKGESSYGDLVEGNVASGMLGGSTSIGFGGTSTSGGNSLNRMRRSRRDALWWSRFSQNTPTTLLAVGSLESWPVMEADDIQVLVKKGDDIEDKNTAANSSSSKSVKATLERWESDLALEVIGRDGYPMRGNQMQPGGQYNNGYNDGSENGRCTQSIKFDVTNGDLYPFSGTISVPPPLAVEDSMGNQKTVMMVLNNPDEDEDSINLGGQFMRQPQYDEYGNELPPTKPSAVEAKVEPLYKSPDEKYAEAQQQQQMQYDEWGNEVYNPQQDQKATIPSNGYQSFELDATDPASGKIKISLEREEGGGGFGGFGGGGNSASEARVEIYHGFKDQYGNPYNNNFGDEEEDKRISLEVSTMHPTFSSVVDTMPANLLAKHALPSQENLNFVQPYLEVRIVNTGGASLKAGVESFLPQYKPQSQQQRQQQQYEKQRYNQRVSNAMALNTASSVKADDPFLLVDSAQSTTSSRRIKDTTGVGVAEKSYVRANNSFSGRSNSAQIGEMWSTGSSSSSSFNRNTFNNYYEDQGMARPSYDRYSTSQQYGSNGLKANNPEDLLRPKEAQTNGYSSNRVMASRRNRGANDYYGYDAIDTVATSNYGTSGLIANNDFTKANGSKTSAIVPGSQTIGVTSGSGNFRRVSPSSTSLQSFGGNSGGASGMQQTFQGGSLQQSRSFGNNNGGRSMFQGRPSSQQEQQQFFGDDNNDGSSMFQGRSSQQQSYGRNGMQQKQTLDQAFSNLTSPKKTRTVKGQRGNWTQKPNRSSSAFSGNGNVIGNGVIAGRPAPASTTVGTNNRMMPNNRNLDSNDDFGNGGFSGGNGQIQRSYSRNRNNNDRFGNAQSSSFESSFTPSPSNNFGGRNNGGSFGQGNANNRMGRSMKQQLEDNDSFSRDFGGNNRNQRRNEGRFGGRSNNNNNNSFGSNNNLNNNSGRFGGSNNNDSGSPFGNLGTPPQTRGNSKNPFATLNGEAGQQQTNGFGGNDNNSNNFYGASGGGGGSQRPMSPQPMKNPFAGLNGNGNNQYSGRSTKNPFAGLNGNGNNQYSGRSTTAMRSTNNMDYGTPEDNNPIADFAKNIVKGISELGKR